MASGTNTAVIISIAVVAAGLGYYFLVYKKDPNKTVTIDLEGGGYVNKLPKGESVIENEAARARAFVARGPPADRNLLSPGRGYAYGRFKDRVKPAWWHHENHPRTINDRFSKVVKSRN